MKKKLRLNVETLRILHAGPTSRMPQGVVRGVVTNDGATCVAPCLPDETVSEPQTSGW